MFFPIIVLKVGSENLDKAKSEITKIFTKGINKYNDLSIAIYKYEASFDGYYFPGKIKYKGKRPLYLWIFGPSRKVKDVVNLPVTLENEAKCSCNQWNMCNKGCYKQCPND